MTREDLEGKIIAIANPNDRITRITTYINSISDKQGIIKVSGLIDASKRLLKAQKDRDKSTVKGDYKNARIMSRVREERCAEELGFWKEVVDVIISDMNINGFCKE
jgi:hypothetical protein